MSRSPGQPEILKLAGGGKAISRVAFKALQNETPGRPSADPGIRFGCGRRIAAKYAAKDLQDLRGKIL